jgi:hypothetical protein
MGNKLVTFLTTAQGRVPAEEALKTFERLSDGLADAMGAAILELEAHETFAETQTVHIDGALWCLQIYHKRKWAFLFFLELPGDIIMLLNGYAKKASKLPVLSATQLRKAQYLIKEVNYA